MISPSRNAPQLAVGIGEAHLALQTNYEYLKQAYDKYVQKRYDEAAVTLKLVLQLEPKNEYALGLLGACLRSQGKYEEAISHFGKVLESYPGHKTANENIGFCCLKLRKNTEGLEYYEKQLDLEMKTGGYEAYDRAHQIAHFLSSAYYKLNNNKKGHEFWQQSIISQRR